MVVATNNGKYEKQEREREREEEEEEAFTLVSIFVFIESTKYDSVRILHEHAMGTSKPNRYTIHLVLNMKLLYPSVGDDLPVPTYLAFSCSVDILAPPGLLIVSFLNDVFIICI